MAVRNLFQLLIKSSGERPLLFLHCRQRGFELGHFGHQLAGFGFVLRLLSIADFLRGGIAPRLRLLKFGDRRAPLFVKRHKFF